MEERIIQRGNETISYTLQRKKVKNINVRVTPEGKVMVSAPKRIALATVEGFLLSKFDWLLLHMRHKDQAEHYSSPAACGFAFFLGRRYPLAITDLSHLNVHLSGGLLVVSVPKKEDSASIDQAVRKWYQQQALSLLPQIYTAVAEPFCSGEHPIPQLFLRQMSASFGNCNHTQNRITLNKRLILMPQRCIQYVVIHELCHTIIPNHSPAFHALVQTFVPKEKELRAELNELYRIYGEMM